MVPHFLLAMIKCSDHHWRSGTQFSFCLFYFYFCLSPRRYPFHSFMTCHDIACAELGWVAEERVRRWYESDAAVHFQYRVFCLLKSRAATHCVFIGHGSSLWFMKKCLGRSKILGPLSINKILQQDVANMLCAVSWSATSNFICRVVSFSKIL